MSPAQARAEDPPSPQPVPVVVSSSSSSSYSSSSLGKLPALVTGGLAVASLITGTVFGILAWEDHESFQTNPSADLANRGESRGLTADMCFGGAATLAVASIVMYLTHEEAAAATPTSETPPRVSLAPFLSPGGGGAGAVLRF
jgi:hypothetical protein